MESKALKEIEEFPRKKLKELLLQCTEEQQGNLEKWCGPVDAIPENKINDLILLCERTIKSNGQIKTRR